MKNFIGLGFITLLSITFFGCGVSKVKSQAQYPFKVLKATYANAVGEQPDLIVTTLKITVNNNEIQLDSVFFRSYKAPLQRVDNAENSIFAGSFTTSTTPHDYILSSDPKKEFGNKPPLKVSKLPFELKENEAVVSYVYKDKVKYYIISEVKQE